MSEKRLPISVHILTRNSGDTLERCLQSVAGCAEILVIDGGSTDNTLAIAKRHGAKILAQPKDALEHGRIVDFAAARNAGLRAAKEAWVLALDSDEEASEELMKELVEIACPGERSSEAFLIPRRYRLPDGRIVRHATTYPNERVYLFRRDAAETWEKPVHERIRLKAGTRIGHLRGWMIAPLGTVAEYKAKNRAYLTLEAKRARSQGWGAWILRVLRALRSRTIATIKLLWIWLLPHRGARLPLAHELARYWYAWRVVVETMPHRMTKHQ